MKINIMIPTILFGGGLRIIFQYANDWVNKGHDVIAYVPMLYREIDLKIKPRTSIANTFLRGTKISWFNCKFKVKKVLAISDLWIRNADITIAVAPNSAWPVHRLSEKKGKKIYFIQGHEVDELGNNLSQIDRTYQYKNLNLVVITHYMQEYIRKNFQRDSKVIPNGIPHDEFLQGPKLPGSKKTIIMLGNFSHYKGGYQGLELLKKIKKEFDIRCIIYGYRYDEQIPSDFEFYRQPKREELMHLYQESDICLFPSIEEGWGLVVTEAMANKCAVVGNNTGCLREFGKHKENALIVENANFDEMYCYIKELLNDTETLRKIQQRGYETVSQYTSEASFEKFECYLKSLLNEETST